MQRHSFLDEFKTAWKKPDNGLIQIILINAIVFILINVIRVFTSISANPEVYAWVINQLALPSDIPAFLVKPWTIITYFFTHESFFHVLFNMLFFFWFGKIIYEFLGNNKLINLYVLGGLIGGFLFILIYNLIPFYNDRVQLSILMGASAGVFAVVVGAATFMPNYTFFLLFLGPIKIKYIAIFYVLLSFFNIDGSNAGGELSHLGGALIGFLYVQQLKKGNDFGQPIISFINFLKSLFVRKPKIKVSYKSTESSKGRKSTAKTEQSKNINQDEIDTILDKISEGGYESLTKEEKQKLFNASKK
ncbi:MAG: rhomboid family intramembrane serine protease [Cyclobacteriaceae bacterium]|jgi:membrane associated rhomboid family serine protease